MPKTIPPDDISVNTSYILADYIFPTSDEDQDNPPNPPTSIHPDLIGKPFRVERIALPYLYCSLLNLDGKPSPLKGVTTLNAARTRFMKIPDDFFKPLPHRPTSAHPLLGSSAAPPTAPQVQQLRPPPDGEHQEPGDPDNPSHPH